MFNKAVKYGLTFLGILFFNAFSAAQKPANYVADDPILANLDSLTVVYFFKNNQPYASIESNKNILYKDAKDQFASYVLKARMEKLDKKSPFDLVYNAYVHDYIVAYANRHKYTVSKMLGMANLYFPLFEQTLRKYNMPLELKYLAIVESALKPRAKSHAGAMGLWQFMYPTGKMMGLDVTSYIDERCDPILATDAACRYLKKLYNYYNGNWTLALASYNAGPGNVNKAIRRAGGSRNFWEIQDYLPNETANYVPAFIAVNYIMNYYSAYNIQPKQVKYFWYELDTLMIKKELKFENISKYLDIDVATLRLLNPIYNLAIIPETETGLPLYLPKIMIGDFMANKLNILNVSTHKKENNFTPASTANTDKMDKTYHRVQKGEYLAAIARKYRVKTSDIMAWNNMKENEVYVGQTLKVYIAKSENPTNEKVQYYTVRSGDTLWSISKKYNMTVDELKELNNLSSNSLSVGKRIKVKEG